MSLNAMTHTATIARLHFLLGELYADAVKKASRRHKPALIGMHGQTIFHEGMSRIYGAQSASEYDWQIGEAAVVAERTGIQTISNFRERDIAAGGQGAPLVPYVDYLLFRHARRGRVALNIGGIANITVIPAGAKPPRGDRVRYGSGQHGNRCAGRAPHGRASALRPQRYHRAARKIHQRLLDAMMSDPYLHRKPPKTTGREQFGQQFVSRPAGHGDPPSRLDRNRHRVYGEIECARDSEGHVGTHRPRVEECITSRSCADSANCYQRSPSCRARTSASIPTRKKRSRSRCWPTNFHAAALGICRAQPGPGAV